MHPEVCYNGIPSSNDEGSDHFNQTSQGSDGRSPELPAGFPLARKRLLAGLNGTKLDPGHLLALWTMDQNGIILGIVCRTFRQHIPVLRRQKIGSQH